MRWPTSVCVTFVFAAGCAALARPADDGVWFKADFSATAWGVSAHWAPLSSSPWAFFFVRL